MRVKEAFIFITLFITGALLTIMLMKFILFLSTSPNELNDHEQTFSLDKWYEFSLESERVYITIYEINNTPLTFASI